MEPMLHWLGRRIEAHIKLCVFELLIERVAELQGKQPWPGSGGPSPRFRPVNSTPPMIDSFRATSLRPNF
jgi:hypothetical protein